MKTTVFPQLNTESCDLIELLPEHASEVFTFTSDEHVAKTAIWDAHLTVDDSAHYIQHVRAKFSLLSNHFYLCWAIKDKESAKVVGLISLTNLGGIRAQIGYVFHYKRWNTKLPAECVREVTRYSLLTFSEIERVQCRCFPTNQSSIELLDTVGYQFEGVNQAMVKVRGKIQDLSCFSMTRKRWSLIQKTPLMENYDLHS